MISVDEVINFQRINKENSDNLEELIASYRNLINENSKLTAELIKKDDENRTLKESILNNAFNVNNDDTDAEYAIHAEINFEKYYWLESKTSDLLNISGLNGYWITYLAGATRYNHERGTDVIINLNAAKAIAEAPITLVKHLS